MLRRLAFLPLLLLAPVTALPQKPGGGPGPGAKKPDALAPDAFAGLRLRSIGPAVYSGRVVGLAVHPRNRSHYFAAVGSGGLWKTTNAGTSWTPVFDNEGSYSVGYVALDPANPEVVWVGTGENNSQRSVGYGDGVYKSLDGGKSWKKVGLEKSEHVGKILIDPRNSDVVYVAAQGPLWGPGGERGLYKTADGGKTWKRILALDENTGVTDVVLDPRNPDVLVAASYQRRRHVWTLINGGPGSAIHRSTDGGATWQKVTAGLPGGDLGRIGLAVAPSNPDVVYATVEAADDKGGVFRSTDRGASWERRNPFDRGAMYYAHLVVDPKNADRIVVMNVLMQASEDGGKTLRPLGEKWKHVDNHCLWIDPADPDYHLVGCDGGIYESFDRAKTWRHAPNLPVTQFYDITCDESGPFYHVYGGTQDNFTLGGPARTRSASGIVNANWFVVHNGDGFQCKVDPRDPNVVYGEAQYGDLVRFDRRTGEAVGIQPKPGRGEPPLRFNWDSPLVLSPHAPTRLYFGANRLFRSDDRGDSWTPVSGDLTRQLDRDKLPVMGKLWGPDAVAKHQSTSLYGNLVALAESPRKEGLLYAGTDDGLIHVTGSGGKAWRKIDRVPGVPERTYVARLAASRHADGRVYAAFDNHKNADFAPYLVRSDDEGQTWVSVAGDLPGNGPVLAFAEDHVDPDLLFVGTEFGLFFTPDGGQRWHRLKGRFPTIPVRDLCIQRQMDDLVVGTFGRGIYVLDDYSPLRKLSRERLKAEAHLFPVKEALQYVPTRPLGLRGKSFLGESYYTASNPPYGAVFTYHLGEGLKTAKQKRLEAEKKGTPEYPSADALRAEAEEEAPTVVLTVRDGAGQVVRTLTGPAGPGFHRVAWDLREPAAVLPSARDGADADDDLFREAATGPQALPGPYTVSLALRVRGVTRPVEGEQAFRVVPHGSTATEADRKALAAFQRRANRLQRAVSGATQVATALEGRLAALRGAADAGAGVEPRDHDRVRELERQTRAVLRALRGDVVLRGRNENTPPSIGERVAGPLEELRHALARPTKTQERLVDEAGEEFAAELKALRKLVEVDLPALQKALDRTATPWTPGRLPAWEER